jgi:hypothetical protein
MSNRVDAALAHAAAPGTLMGLHLALKARLAVVAAAFPLLETKTTARAPDVFDFTLPPKTPNGEQFPFLALRARGGSDSEQAADENSRATIDIEIGTYSDTEDGYFDLLLIVEAIRTDLGAAPAISGTAYEQVGPLTWDVPFPQPRPQWLGLVTTTWSLPRPRRVEARNPEEG